MKHVFFVDKELAKKSKTPTISRFARAVDLPDTLRAALIHLAARWMRCGAF